MALTINTNMSAIKAQHALASSTKKLNQAIERMTTGYKINSAKDDAAGYAIAKNMDVKLSSYEVAMSNTMMATSLLSTATNSMDILTDHLQRIRDLCEQAANGTYSEDSRFAIQTEIDQRIDEINRIIDITEYNGINLFKGAEVGVNGVNSGVGVSSGDSTSSTTSTSSISTTPTVTASKGPNGKFIDDVDTVTPDIICDKTNTTYAADLKSKIVANNTIGIADAETLKLLADVVNGTGVKRLDCSGKTICLTSDIDLSVYSNWTSIGNDSYSFEGTFNGNGHVVSNLKINRPTTNSQGLFGCAGGTIKNVGIENCDVKGADDVGGLVGHTDGDIENSYATGNVSGNINVGGLAGYTDGDIENSYSTGNVTGKTCVGGLIGLSDGFVENCYATGDVIGTDNEVGGLVGSTVGDIKNSYAKGDVKGKEIVGGLVGEAYNISGSTSYAEKVTGDSFVGGLVGIVMASDSSEKTTISNSTSYTENVTGNSKAGEFIGGVVVQYDTNPYGTLDIQGCQCIDIDSLDKIEGPYNLTTGIYTKLTSYDMTAWNNGIKYTDPPVPPTPTSNKITFQVGITSSENSRISVDTALNLGEISIDVSTTNSARKGLDTVDSALAKIMNKQTELGSVQNRLDSVVDAINVSIDNLTSSVSTIKDADIAKVSSEYINAQILQQASATLLATANQSPSIALQLI